VSHYTLDLRHLFDGTIYRSDIRRWIWQHMCLILSVELWAGLRNRYSDWVRAGRSGDRNPMGARFSTPVQTGPGAHPATCTIGTGSFQGVKSGRGVTLTPYRFLVLWSRKVRAIPLLPQWAARPVQSLSVCTRMHFIFSLKRWIELWYNAHI
jgi:hypothetical protein